MSLPTGPGADAPVKGHLAVLTDKSGDALAIPPGATMFIVEDPRRMDKTIPLILLKVTKSSIHFACGCGRCTKRYVFKLVSMTGHHTETADRTRAALGRAKRGG